MRGDNGRLPSGRARASRLRRRIATALVLLLALRALVPEGYMLSRAALAEGQFRVTLCDGYTTREVTVDAEGNIVAEHGSTDSQANHCDFAMASLLGTLAAPLALAAVLPPRLHSSPAPTSIAFLRPQLRGPPLGSRAPPQLPA